MEESDHGCFFCIAFFFFICFLVDVLIMFSISVCVCVFSEWFVRFFWC